MAHETVGSALAAAARRLDAVDGSGRLDATLLLEFVTGRSRDAFISGDREPLAGEHAAAFARSVERRLRGEPVAYIIGSAGFYGRTFAVDERVLVPRPETEHVLEAVLADVRGRGAAGGRIADVGTGCGAIAITLAAELPDAWLFGTDISAAAVSVARRNAARNNVFQQCTFLTGDLAEPLVRFAPFAAVVANLPYIPTADVPRAPEPAGYEPPLALDGGADGLDLYRRLLAQLPPLLAPDAGVFLEAAPGTIDALAALVETAFAGAFVEIGEDYAALERFVQFTLAASD